MMKTIHSTNRDIQKHIDKHELVVGSYNHNGTNGHSIWAENSGGLYVVYSYGYHFPMYLYDKSVGVWFGNSDKYSNSTSKHQLYARPTEPINQWLSTSEMKKYIGCGSLVEYLIDKERRADRDYHNRMVKLHYSYSPTN